MKPSPLRPWYTDRLLWPALLVVGSILAGLSIARYQGYNTNMLDLGAMSQAIFSVTRGEPLVTTGNNGNFSRLSGHVELFYFFLALPTLLWHDPQVLLIAQALLAVAGAIPAYRLAARRLESQLAARCVALIYLLYPVAQTAILFDLHGDTLAMPLLMFALDAIDRRAWGRFAAWAALAMLCKLYVALPILGIGAYLFLWGGQRRAGLIIGAGAVAYGAFAFLIIREWFVIPVQSGQSAVIYTSHYFGDLAQIPASLPQRVVNALIVFGPALLLGWRGWRWLLVGAPVAVAALISTGPGEVYDYRYHHYALVVPFVIMAIIDGAAQLKQRQATTGTRKARNWRADLIFNTLVVGLVASLLVDTPLNPLFWLGVPGYGLDTSVYGVTARDDVKDRFLAEHAPPLEPLIVSSFMAPHVADRSELYLTRYNNDPGGERLPELLPRVNTVIADALFDWRTIDGEQFFGGVDYERVEIAMLLRNLDFALTHAQDGLLLFERNASPEQALTQTVAIVERADLPPLNHEYGPIRLIGAQITPLEGRRYRAEFEWQLSGTQPPERPLFAVSRLEGVVNQRIVHLPTYVLLPSNEWQPGQIIRESFVIEIAPEIAAGGYTWLLGWYEAHHPNAYATDEQSLVDGTHEQAIGTIEVRQ